MSEPLDLDALRRALHAGDVDAALRAGLMVAPSREDLLRAGWSEDEVLQLATTREQRTVAWAARDRYLARNARQARRKEAREAAHRAKDASTSDTLPPAANAALARALARARKPGA